MSAPEPQNQVSNLRLKVSYWYVIHKLQLKKILVVFLIVLSVILYGYSLYRAIIILAVQDNDYRQMMTYLSAPLIDYSAFRERNRPNNIEILSFGAVGGRQNRYDYVARIKNPNPNFVITEVVFELISGSEVIAQKTTFVLPNEEKYVAFFGQESKSGSPTFKTVSIKWHRVFQFENFSVPRLNFEISEIDFKSANESGIKGELPVSTLNFKIKNATAYSYWQVGVNMVLSSFSGVAAANYLSLDQFLAGQTRNVEMRWYEPLPDISKIEILPEVDILDESVYMPVE